MIKQSTAFRSRMLRQGKHLSYADCVNYVTAQPIGAKLLTGDREFEEIDGVEYVG